VRLHSTSVRKQRPEATTKIRQLSASIVTINRWTTSLIVRPARAQMLALPWLTFPPVFFSWRKPPNKASLSRNLHSAAPSLVHTLSQEHNSILSVATGDNHIYSGSQNNSISVRAAFLSSITLSGAR